jgi:hypothetical protein
MTRSIGQSRRGLIGMESFIADAGSVPALFPAMRFGCECFVYTASSHYCWKFIVDAARSRNRHRPHIVTIPRGARRFLTVIVDQVPNPSYRI